MEPVEHGCHPEIEEQDDDSIIEECWKAKYKGDSRKWLIRDASYKTSHGLPISSMKAAYMYPVSNGKQTSNQGQKKSMLLQKFYEEAFEEVTREANAPSAVEDYCTEYDGNYKIPGFKVDDEAYKKHPELHIKYPLYDTTPTTVYSYHLQHQFPKQYIPGMTTTTDLKSPFKRSSRFTTPLSEKLEDKFY